jgi:hypothetical protein
MGKYMSGGEKIGAPLGNRGCGNLQGAYVNDEIGKGCWAITGYKIPMGDRYASIQAAAEICNFNFRAEGTCSPVPAQVALEGPIMSGVG